MRTLTTSLSIAALFTAALTAQTQPAQSPPTQSPPAQAPANKAPTFHLPAGDYSVAELVQQAGQALRRPMHLQPDLPNAAAPIRLQCDLALTQQAWEDALGALLGTRGLVLARDAAGTGQEVLPAPSGMVDWITERAQTMTPRELLERRAFAGPVRVLAKAGEDTRLWINVLRPTFAGGQHSLAYHAVDGGVEFVGLAQAVRFALLVIAEHAPLLASTLPEHAPRAWPRPAPPGAHRLEAGEYTAAALVDRLAKAVGRNIVASPAVTADTTPVPVAAPIEGDAQHFEDVLTTLLWTRCVLVVEVAPTPELSEAVQIDLDAGPEKWPPSWRAQQCSPQELLARPALVAWISTAPAVGGLTPADVVGEFRAATRATKGVSSMTASALSTAMRLSGLSTEVTPLLQRLEQKKAGK